MLNKLKIYAVLFFDYITNREPMELVFYDAVKNMTFTLRFFENSQLIQYRYGNNFNDFKVYKFSKYYNLLNGYEDVLTTL